VRALGEKENALESGRLNKRVSRVFDLGGECYKIYARKLQNFLKKYPRFFQKWSHLVLENSKHYTFISMTHIQFTIV
jgi:hypothetical protein